MEVPDLRTNKRPRSQSPSDESGADIAQKNELHLAATQSNAAPKDAHAPALSPTSSLDPASQSSRFAALPRELLELIFSHLPLRGLLHVVSFVCQRFRRVVPLAVRSLPENWWKNVPTITVLSYCNLDSLIITPRTHYTHTESRTLGSRVSSIQIDGLARMDLRSFECRKLQTLTVGYHHNGEDLAGRLQSVSTMISKLHLNASLSGKQAIYFPHLRYLTSLKSAEDNVELILAHISQLTALEMNFCNKLSQSGLCAQSAPNLTSLHIGISDCTPALTQLYHWIYKLPSLTSLSLRFFSHRVSMPSCPDLVHSLVVNGGTLGLLMKKNVTYTNLRHLSLAKPWQPALFSKAVTSAMHLRSLSMPLALLLPTFVTVASPLVMLEELHLHSPDQVERIDESLFHWKLPHLRVLRLQVVITSQMLLKVEVLRRIVRTWPSLRVIHFRLFAQSYCPFDAQVLQQLDQVSAEAEQSGLRELHIGGLAMGWDKELARLYRRRKWLRIVDNFYLGSDI